MLRGVAGWVLLGWVALILLGVRPAWAGEVQVLTVDGPIVPVVAEYLDRGLAQAEAREAVCVIELNTPGGLYETTQKIVTRILNAKVPVVVYVSPAGGWAASAGTFITMAAHVAAMAPGSRIGAAHPVGLGGSDTQASAPEMQKITEDAAAWVRSIAQARGRDPVKAEAAVRESRSFTDREALEGNLIDLRAKDLADLLSQLHGRRVKLEGGREVELDTVPAALARTPMTWVEQFLFTITNPSLAYVLMTVGMLGLVMELYHPGATFPGVIGGISLLLALYSLGTLNAYWGGILLMVLAFILFAAEAFTPTFGLLTAGGLAALVLGSFLLFSRGGSFPQISLGLIFGMAGAVTAFFVLVVGAVVRGQKRQVVTGKEALVGAVGRVITDLAPKGTVLVEGERWHATAEDGSVEAGTEVVVTAVEGLKLKVRRKNSG
ncbi:MAG: NfeD family protein [Moorellales bacterium]